MAVIRTLQGDMPVVAEPYAPAAAELGITQERAARAPGVDEGAPGAAARGGDPLPPPRRLLGQRHGRLEACPTSGSSSWARRWPRSAASRTATSGPTYADWPYSVFTMAHGRSKEECDAILDSIAESTGIEDRSTLYSSTEFKKIRLLYFTDEHRRWEAEHLTPGPWMGPLGRGSTPAPLGLMPGGVNSPGAGHALDRPRPAVRGARRGRRARGRGRQPLRGLGHVLGAAGGGPRAPGRGGRRDGGRRARHELRRAHRGGERAGGRDRGARARAPRWCG